MYTTSALTAGVHQITAVYNGDAAKQIQGSTSAVLNQDVQAPTTATLTLSLNPSNYGNSVTFTVTIPPSGTVAPTGTVSFLDGATQIGTGTLKGNPGVATFTTSTLNVGTHPITASYAGDSTGRLGHVGLSQDQQCARLPHSEAMEREKALGTADRR